MYIIYIHRRSHVLCHFGFLMVLICFDITKARGALRSAAEAMGFLPSALMGKIPTPVLLGRIGQFEWLHRFCHGDGLRLGQLAWSEPNFLGQKKWFLMVKHLARHPVTSDSLVSWN